MRLRMYGATDKGLVRATNQDAYYCSADFGLVVLSDGMGGHRGGEIASELTVVGLRDAYLKRNKILSEDISSFLDEVLQKINNEIFSRSQADENLRGMGATVNILQFAGGFLAVGHAGDSRTYLVRTYQGHRAALTRGLWQLTVDHNVETFVKRGLLVPGRDFPQGPLSDRIKARLTRGMGVVQELKADLYSLRVCNGDVFLTCTDGLHGMASAAEILGELCRGPLAQAPARLIALAKKHGAADNVTVVVSTVADEEEPLQQAHTLLNDGGRGFLIRKPSGEVVGLFSVGTFLAQWSQGEFAAESEISCGTREWIFLNQKDQLLSAYPELNVPAFKRQFDLLMPLSQEMRPLEFQPSPQKRPSLSYLFLIGIIAILLMIFLFFFGSH